MRRFFIVVLLLGLAALVRDASSVETTEVIGLDGESVRLPCNVDKAKCGEIYFITWSKNVSDMWKRVYTFNDKVQAPLLDLNDGGVPRADFFLKNSSSILQIAPLRLSDEAHYKCDVTYLKGGCPSLSYTNLIVHAKPKPPLITSNGSENTHEDGTVIGPLLEEESFDISCSTVGAKPRVNIEWFQEGQKLNISVKEETKDGYINSRATYQATLKRKDIGAKFECKVTHETLAEPYTAGVSIDLHLKPKDIQLIEPKMPIEAGERMKAICELYGAKPAADAVWYNGTQKMAVQPQVTPSRRDDDTIDSRSVLDVGVTRYDHNRTFSCRGTNKVMDNKGTVALTKSYVMQILFTPDVWIERADNETVKTGASVKLICNYTANPTNIFDFQFAKDNITLPKESNLYETKKDEGPPLFRIISVRREDHGNYSCVLKNEIGWGNSTNSIFLDVMFPPNVSLVLNPVTIKEPQDEAEEKAQVYLKCEVNEGNPVWLSRIRWYHNGKLFNETNDVELTLTGITREHSGNYSCQGENDADYGPISDPKFLDVQFAPGPARVVVASGYAVKNKPAQLQCILDDLGHPTAEKYKWDVNNVLTDFEIKNFTIENVTMTTQANYSCKALNSVGEGPRGYMDLNLFAPPSIVEPLPPVFGALYNDTDIILQCRAECSPVCSIEWFRTANDVSLYNLEYDPQFSIETIVDPSDTTLNYFSGVVSYLKFNLGEWPHKVLERDKDKGNITCRSSSNFVGPSVNSTTHFRVEYAPEGIRVNPDKQRTRVADRYDMVTCRASAVPKPTYIWMFGDQILSETKELIAVHDLKKEHAGNYTCIASNKYGNATRSAFIDVIYKPTCIIELESSTGDEENKDQLVCKIIANPAKVTVNWYRNNKELHKNIEQEGSNSILKRDEDSDIFQMGEYKCSPNNTVGFSECAFNVDAAAALPPGLLWIILAVIIIVLLIVIIIILICMFRRRGKPDGAAPHERNGSGVYQNVTKGGQGLPPPLPPQGNPNVIAPPYENIPFKRPQKQQIGAGEDIVYADMYEDIKSGKIPDPRTTQPNLPPKKETGSIPPLPPKAPQRQKSIQKK